MLRRLIHWWRERNFCNPYSVWDTSLNPQYWVWEHYHEPVSSVSDERLYSNGAVRFLESNAVLITDHIEIEDKTDTDDDDLFPLYSQGQRSKRFWFKHNLVSATVQDDDTYKLEFYRAASQKSVHEEFAKWVVERKGDSKVSILIRKNGSLVANKVSFKPPVIDDLELNYGTGFNKTYAKMKGILDSGKSSLTLLHGAPGSGKSTLLKHLSSVVSRDWIFIPTGLADQLASPDFISLLMDKKGAILILEDAEGAVQTRGNERSNETAVSTLLNLTDGVLGSILDLAILVTYNCDKQFIDPALLRKGRLSLDLSLGPLSIPDAKRLATHLGKTIDITSPMTLADLYGADTDTGYTPPKERQVGFHTLIATPKTGGEKEKEGE